ncbi:MAG TPA: primase-helicase family protein [Stellaceae bacterium]|nr:primase-helicase family protein [Stellaceae bacterium]
MVLRHDPLKLQYKDYEYHRIAIAHYSFRYRDRHGKPKLWFPSVGEMLGALEEGEELPLLVIERLDFMPGQPEVTREADGSIVINLWRAPSWQVLADAESPTLFLDHLAYLFDNDDAAINHTLNWMAHLVQQPASRIDHALLITSEAKGVGKSTVGQIVRRLVGERNARTAQTKDLKSQFDGWLAGKLFVQVDEVYESGNWELANKLKSLITEPMVSVNLKYGPQIEIKNYARLMMFSNHTAPLNLEDGDRRYFVFNSPAQPRSDDYYGRLHSFINSDDGMNAIYSFLMSRDLSGFNPHRRPPMTAAKKEIVEVSGNPLSTYIAECLASGHLFDELKREFTYDALERLLQKEGYGAHAKNQRELGQALEKAGIRKLRRTIDRQKRRFFVLPDWACKVSADEDDPASEDPTSF